MRTVDGANGEGFVGSLLINTQLPITHHLHTSTTVSVSSAAVDCMLYVSKILSFYFGGRGTNVSRTAIG